MLFGYARISTAEQPAGLEGQVRDLKAAGCGRVWSEQVSGGAKRLELEVALDFVRQGDVLVVTKPDRLARSTRDLVGIVDRLKAKGAGLVILTMGGMGELNTSSPTGELMMTMLAAIAAFELQLTLDRRREGIAKAKSEGRYKGRAPTAQRQTADVLQLEADGLGPTAIAERLSMSRRSVYRILNAAKSEGRYEGQAPSAERRATEALRLEAAGLGPTAIAERLGMSRSWAQRIVKAVNREGRRSRGRGSTAQRQAADVLRLKADGLGPAAIAERLGMSRSSAHRILKAAKRSEAAGATAS